MFQVPEIQLYAFPAHLVSAIGSSFFAALSTRTTTNRVHLHEPSLSNVQLEGHLFQERWHVQQRFVNQAL